jgi:tetratricopeptide (TPR) repeat protein
MKEILAVLSLLVAGNPGAADQGRAVLVFPFENQSSRPDLHWISESFAEGVSSRLSGRGRYVVDRQERNAVFEQMRIPAGTPLTLASKYKLAEALEVDWAIVGRFEVEGDRLIARAQLLDVGLLKLLPTFETSGELTDLVDLQTRLAWRLLATYDSEFTVGTEENFRREFPEVRLDAFEKYIRGVLATDPEARVRFLREADRLNPADRRAALELGRHYFDEKDYVNSARWCRKLDGRDPDYAEAAFLLGVDEFFMGREPAAEKAFSELAARIPLNEALNNLGFLRARRGRYPEALADLERAYASDPADPDYSFNLAACLSSLNRFEEAFRYLEEALRLTPEDPEIHSLLAMVLGKLGRREDERREVRWLQEYEGDSTLLEAEGFVPSLRLKETYDARTMRKFALAARRFD